MDVGRLWNLAFSLSRVYLLHTKRSRLGMHHFCDEGRFQCEQHLLLSEVPRAVYWTYRRGPWFPSPDHEEFLIRVDVLVEKIPPYVHQADLCSNTVVRELAFCLRG